MTDYGITKEDSATDSLFETLNRQRGRSLEVVVGEQPDIPFAFTEPLHHIGKGVEVGITGFGDPVPFLACTFLDLLPVGAVEPDD